MTEQLTIDFSSENFNDNHKLSLATLAQIMMAIQRILGRISNPENTYQAILYPWLQKNVTILTDEFNKVLKYNSEVNRSVIYYNVGGRLLYGTEIKMKYHSNVSLGHGNLGPFIEAAIQRTEFILNRKTPDRYENKQEYIESFETLKTNLNVFLEQLKKVQDDFKDTVTKARNTVNMNEVKQRRKEKTTIFRNKRTVLNKKDTSTTSNKTDNTDAQNNSDEQNSSDEQKDNTNTCTTDTVIYA